MSIQHKDIPDSGRHEVKGASTALLGQVPISNGDGTTTFGSYDYNRLTNKPTISGYKFVLYGASVASSQQPSATNTPIQIEFGSAQTTTDVSLSAAGLITFNTAGDYLVDLFLRFGRTSATGQAVMFNRLVLNGAQALRSNSITLDNAVNTIPFSASIPFTVAAGDTLALQIYRDSVGVNNGGLIQTVPTLGGWAASPSASLQISKFKGV